jgi:hypothetical protein
MTANIHIGGAGLKNGFVIQPFSNSIGSTIILNTLPKVRLKKLSKKKDPRHIIEKRKTPE